MNLLNAFALSLLISISASADDVQTCNTLGFAPKVIHQTVHVGTSTIPYTVTIGFTPVPQASGTLGACVFSTRYTRDDVSDLNKRPLTFLYNGGPGSSSGLIHFGGVGPERLDFGDDGIDFSKGPSLSENPNTFLDFTDLVFVDPVGTGYTLLAPGVAITAFEGDLTDAKILADFVKTSINTLARTASPLFLVGESYGGIRTPIAANLLSSQYKIKLNGLVMLSPVLDYRNVSLDQGNNQAYITSLPTLTSIAHYYQMSTPEIQSLDLESAYEAAKTYATTTYADALFAGASLDPATFAAVQLKVKELSGDPGISFGIYEGSTLTTAPVLQFQGFQATLLASKNLTLSVYDGRVASVLTPEQVQSWNDPIDIVSDATFKKAASNYFTQTFGVPTPLVYVNTYSPSTWTVSIDAEDFTSQAYSAGTPDLQTLMLANPHFNVYIGSGLYDDSVPTDSLEYTINQLDPLVAKRIHISHFPSGHMIYFGKNNAIKLATEVKAYVAAQIGN